MASKILLLLLIALSNSLIAEEPWEYAPLKETTPISHSYWFSSGFETIILFHQKVISEADGPRSSFKPSSSEYMRQAIQKYGFFSGFCYGCDRLLRENGEPSFYPLYKTKDGHYLKWDPVP